MVEVSLGKSTLLFMPVENVGSRCTTCFNPNSDNFDGLNLPSQFNSAPDYITKQPWCILKQVFEFNNLCILKHFLSTSRISDLG